MSSASASYFAPPSADLVLNALSRRYPGRSVDLGQLYVSDPQAREIFESFTECEMALNRLSKEPISDIARLREYRHIQAELESEINQILTRQT